MKRTFATLALLLCCALPALCAGEITAQDTTGQTLYAVEYLGAQVMTASTGALGTEADGSWSAYAIPLTEIGTTGNYAGNEPTGAAANKYAVAVYEEATPGTVSLAADQKVGYGSLEWGGASLVTLTGVNAALPSAAGIVSALFGASYLTIPAGHTTSGTGETLTYKQWMALGDAVSGGDNSPSGPPVAGGTASVTYYLRGAAKLPANIVAVATVTYDANKNQTGRSVLVAQPFPAVQ